MGIELAYVVVALTAFAAFYVKGITGAGTTIVIVSITSFVLSQR